jgi:transposase-like protein
MVVAALRSVFAQQSKDAVLEQWDQVSTMLAALAAKFPRVAELMTKAREDVLAFRHFPLPARVLDTYTKPWDAALASC